MGDSADSRRICRHAGDTAIFQNHAFPWRQRCVPTADQSLSRGDSRASQVGSDQLERARKVPLGHNVVIGCRSDAENWPVEVQAASVGDLAAIDLDATRAGGEVKVDRMFDFWPAIAANGWIVPISTPL